MVEEEQIKYQYLGKRGKRGKYPSTQWPIILTSKLHTALKHTLKKKNRNPISLQFEFYVNPCIGSD